jgi:DNA-binding PadR family transcriptional regulator
MTKKQKKVIKMGEPKAREVQIKLMRGLLDLVVMQFLKAHPMHGYQIIATLRKQFGVYFGPSTIYPLLSDMEENGYIKSQWDLENDRPRKVYSITHEGEELLSCTEDSLSHIYRKLEIGTGKIPFNGNNLSVKCLTNGKKDSRGHVGRATIQRF